MRASGWVRGPGPENGDLMDLELELIFKDLVNLWMLQSQRSSVCAHLNGEPQPARSSETGLSVFL